MKKFEVPKIQIVRFSVGDVITTSLFTAREDESEIDTNFNIPNVNGS